MLASGSTNAETAREDRVGFGLRGVGLRVRNASVPPENAEERMSGREMAESEEKQSAASASWGERAWGARQTE